MKKILIFIFSILFTSCFNNVPEDVVVSEGEITQIYKQGSTTYIKVEFESYPKDKYPGTQWYISSDTCRVGQLVKLR